MSNDAITNTPDNNNYNALYIAVSETRGNPTVEQLKVIIAIVQRDFPINDKNNY